MTGDREESRLPITTAVGLAVAMATVWFAQEPLRTSRPPIDKHPPRQPSMIQARLWQDPIEAVESGRHRNLRKDNNTSLARIDVLGFKEHSPRASTVVLLVITSGSPYVENHEKRLRDRYALLSALSTACFKPIEEEHIRHALLTKARLDVPYEWFRARQTKDCHQDTVYRDHFSGALVVWVTADMLGKKPIQTLNDVARDVQAQYRKDVCRNAHSLACISRLTFKIIGPHSSSLLRAMLREEVNESLDWPNSSSQIEIYSPWATAAPDILLYGLNWDESTPSCAKNQNHSCETDLEDLLSRRGIVLAHATPSDQEVAVALARELQRRRVRLGKDPIALIGEWDSFYGRALPIVIRAAVCVVANETKSNDRPAICPSMTEAIRLQLKEPGLWQDLHSSVFRYTYLRGIDGVVPEDGQELRRATTQDPAFKPTSPTLMKKPESDERDDEEIADLERSEGESQLDYVLRLVAKMKHDADRRGVRRSPKAIGILGSDVYDTLLILKALRTSFPEAIFFSTKMDARLLHEDEYKWTRNMVIATQFGLTLNDRIQAAIPPFRDGNQTSAYFATLRALGHIRQGSQTVSDAVATCPESGSDVRMPFDRYDVDLGRTAFSAQLCPRLFEVGRHGAVDLSADPGAWLGTLGELQSIHPIRRLESPGTDLWRTTESLDERTRLGYALLGLLAAILISLAAFTQYPGKLGNWMIRRLSGGRWGTWMRRPRFNVLLESASLALLAVLVIAIMGVLIIRTTSDGVISLLLHDGWEGEPYLYLEGVSTWPSIAIRSLVIFWCLACLVMAYRILRQNQRDAQTEFRVDSSETVQTGGGGLSRFVRALGWIKAVPEKSDSPVRATEVWREYSQAALFRNRLGRSVLLFIVFVVLVVSVLSVLDVPGLTLSPCRGAMNCAVDFVVTWSAIGAMVLLNMFVVDAVMLCQSLIVRLKGAPVVWPDDALHRFHEQTNIDRETLPHLLVVRFVADQTHAVHKLVFCPFVALFLMFVSRNRIFDNWDFPLALIVIWLLYAVMAAGSTITLRFRANEVRSLALSRLREQLVFNTGLGEDKRAQAEQIRLTIDDIQRLRRGAYTSLALHPAFSAGLLALISFVQYWYLGQ